jgi:hypothetical protein
LEGDFRFLKIPQKAREKHVPLAASVAFPVKALTTLKMI